MSGLAGLIVLEKRVSDRRNMVCKLLNIANCLRKMQNFHSLMSFIAAFSNAAVSRLKWTQEGLPGTTFRQQICINFDIHNN
jgi:hypothetical protein